MKMSNFIIRSAHNSKLIDEYPMLQDKVKSKPTQAGWIFYYCEDANVYEFAEYIIENAIWDSIIINKIDKEKCAEYEKPYDYELIIYDEWIE